jgi:hypothetical protein
VSPPAASLGHAVSLASQVDLWRLIDQTFKAEQVEQLPGRARLLQILELLDRGRHLTLSPNGQEIAVWLEGIPDIRLFAGILFNYRYVAIAERSENGNLVYFTLSQQGQRKLDEGLEWWRSLGFLQKLWIRIRG